MMEENINGKKKIIVFSIIAFLAVAVIVFTIITTILALKISNATKSYNEAIRKYNELSQKYDSLCENCYIDNIQGLPDTFNLLNEEKTDFGKCFTIVFSNNSSSKIKKDTQTVNAFSETISNSIKILEQITGPSQEWVMQKLQTIDGINGIQAVTADNNPDGLLNKEGGYKACIYFSHSKLRPEGAEEIVTAGTDVGGAIEIYNDVDSAIARCEYLAQFDGTILYSGSYAIIGTMVVRTSYAFSNEEQFELTDLITKTFTSID